MPGTTLSGLATIKERLDALGQTSAALTSIGG